MERVVGEQPTGQIDRDERQVAALGLPAHHLPTGLVEHPGIDLGDQPDALGNGNEITRRNHAPLRVLPAHQGFETHAAQIVQGMHRLVEHPQFMVFQRMAQLACRLYPVLGVGGQFLGIQGVAGTPVALGLEQRRVGVAQQLFGTRRIAGVEADADAGSD